MIKKPDLPLLDDLLAEPWVRRILFFDDMITPNLIHFAYWLTIVAAIWHGLGVMFSNGFFGLFEGAVTIVLGVVVARVVSELIMLFFKIQEDIETLARKSAEGSITAHQEIASSKVATTTRKVTKKVGKKVTRKTDGES